MSFFQKASSSARGGQGKGAIEKMEHSSVSLTALRSAIRPWIYGRMELIIARPTRCFPASAGAPATGKAIARKEGVQLSKSTLFISPAADRFGRAQFPLLCHCAVPRSGSRSIRVAV